MKEIRPPAAVCALAVFSAAFMLSVSCATGNSAGTSAGGLFSFCGDPEYVSPHNVSAAAAENQSEGLSDGWWRNSAFYHIWVKSFADSDGDGCGDFKGIEKNLDYIQNSVGCDAIWLSPIVDCSGKSRAADMNMHGYDAIDYYAVNDCFGTEADLVSLINACHARGMKIIFDFVPNHTSPEHPWFKASAAGRAGKRRWYLWSGKKLRWDPMGSTDSWHQYGTAYYYGAFWSGMLPDLNFRNYEVREEMKNVARWWLNKGFDGFRVDAVRYLVEDDGVYVDTAETHRWFQELLADVLDVYESPKFMVSESWIEGSRSALDAYFGGGTEFQMVFDFEQGRPCISSVQNGRDLTASTLRGNPSPMAPGGGRSYGTFLGNHDEYAGRLGTRVGADPKKIKQATALSLLRPTVPFIYYGNEIGQKETSYSGDHRLRGEFQWDDARAQMADGVSPLALNKAVLSLRKAYAEAFSDGTVVKLAAADPRFLAYFIESPSARFLCVYNFSNASAESARFSGVSAESAFRNASCLIGDAAAPRPDCSGGTVTVRNLAPYAYRLYLLDRAGPNVFDDETYTAGGTYTPVNDPAPIFMPSSSMYLRGSMNGWGGEKMAGARNADGDMIWSCTFYFSEPCRIEYKY
nr:hypothetical protein [Treponemataceae bacterium]